MMLIYISFILIILIMLTLNHRHKQLEQVCEKYTKRKEHDNVYVYGSCADISSKKDKSRKWLVVLKKLENTLTNEKRSNVVDHDHAKFRANRLEVVEIINMKNPKQTKNRIIDSYEYSDEKLSGKKVEVVYEVNNFVDQRLPTVECDNFDLDVDVVNGSGIYYFKTIISAYCYEMVPNHYYVLPKSSKCLQRLQSDTKCEKYDEKHEEKCDENHDEQYGEKYDKYPGYVGKWIGWHDNGAKAIEGEYLNGVRENKWKYWHDNGQKKCLEHYKNGLRDGKCFRWDDSGYKTSEEFYVDGKREGIWINWYDNCRQIYICNYQNDVLNGRWVELYDYCKKSSDGSYKDGKPDQTWSEYGPNGEKISEAFYEKGIRESIILWNSDGSVSYDSLLHNIAC
jgi:antitoxin component YwqK of YwqJK toxin-antitoxin module